jgi:hypothetical protein
MERRTDIGVCRVSPQLKRKGHLYGSVQNRFTFIPYQPSMLMAKTSTYDNFQTYHMLMAEPSTYFHFLKFKYFKRKTCHMLMAQPLTYMTTFQLVICRQVDCLYIYHSNVFIWHINAVLSQMFVCWDLHSFSQNLVIWDFACERVASLVVLQFQLNIYKNKKENYFCVYWCLRILLFISKLFCWGTYNKHRHIWKENHRKMKKQ